MASYSVLVKRSAAKELERLPERVRRQIALRIQALGSDPRPAGCEKLTGQDRYRLRQGNHRIVYSIADTELTVLVIRVAHRRDVDR